MITILMRRVLPLVSVATVLVACVHRIHVDDPGSDMWFHLRIGREFLSGWSVADPGHLGAFDNAEWTPTQWLPQMAMAAMNDAFGVGGVVWLAGAVQVVLLLTIYVLCRREAAPLPAALTTALAFLALSIGLSPRPQVLSYLLVTVTVFAWLASARDGRPRWWLVAIAWIWAPLHGMWPLAAVIGAVSVAGIALDRDHDLRRVSRLALIPALSAIVPVLTPVGPDLYRSVLLVGGRSEYFQEWGPTDFHEPHAVVLALMLAIAVVHAARSRQSWLSILLLLMAAGWAVYSSRTTPVAAAIVAPLVARAFQSAVPTADRPGRREQLALVGLGALTLTLFALIAPSRGDRTVVPPWTDERLSALPQGTRVLDDWATGPYYLWKHPELSLVMHGYGDVFTDAEIKRNQDIMMLNPGWDDEVTALDAEAALVSTDSPLGWALRRDSRWTVVEEDNEFVFLMPRD
ncbi:hypothetical protein GCM10011376_19010 [Nocardioides flavus (ex Wang et al. 2016)]|uniref:Glycosyltransferase RgtA/B/C/D-like domain-containing protein n=1 Tax=Nocardioides flavus (ex Wang et al. 2016) TaxID=2058780 RepID=A0ABQ3HIB5_9ACTN|nr:hypothetical protein [Nocardioides flavus (ex Wang et al. 2016)]GHE17291.1 hypothetical protein GCM10011376_19010 [Nocardioides flavus (ex Wang et al. 2016)]